MAPANGACKPRKGMPRPVVPALPLSLEKRRPASTPVTNVVPTPPPRPQTNGYQAKAAKQEEAGSIEVVAAEATPPAEAAPVNGTNTAAPKPTVATSTSSDSTYHQPHDRDGGTHATHARESVVPTSGHRPTPSTDSRGPPTSTSLISIQSKEETQSNNSSTSRPTLPVVSPTRFQMPPSADNAHRFPIHSRHVDNYRIPRPPIQNGPPAMHHPALSNGSVQFGNFQLPDSNTSSPAPPPSGGLPHPPGPPPGALEGPGAFADRGIANGFPPPMMPYGREFIPVSDGYGRPHMAISPMDAAYPPFIGNFGPSTPHSFHGSQSSAPNDDSAAFGPYPGPPQNGNAHREDARMHHAVAPPFAMHGPRMMHGPPPPHMLPPVMDTAANPLLQYIQGQFGDPTYSDCTLELRYLDDRAAPVRIPGHRFMFARSPTLLAMLQSTSPDSSPHGLDQRTILLQSDDRFIRSEPFWTAVQNLYGWPLLPLDVPPANEAGELSLAGNTADRFEFALGYVAAGHLLRWEPVVGCGIEIAKKLLNWDTVEKALDFALGDLAGKGTANDQTRLPYGQPARFLLANIISFIINNFPPKFVLDTTVADPDKYARLPAVPSFPVPAKNAPTIVRGTSVHLGPGHRPKLSHIKFGDMSPSGLAGDGAGSDTARGPPAPPPAWHAILSRILLNLPFAFLRPILESGGQGNVSAWANAEARHRVIKEVIAERELRRTRALASVKAGRVPNLLDVQFRLASQEPQAGSTEWDVLGFREEVAAFGNGDTPTLIQKWIPLVVEHTGPGHSTPAPRQNGSDFL